MKIFKDIDGKLSSADQFICEGVDKSWFKEFDVTVFSSFNEYNAHEILFEFVNLVNQLKYFLPI